MNSAVEESHGVVVPLHRLEVSAPHKLPFAIGTFDSIGPLSRAEFPHRHTFHEIVYVTGGRGSHVVDLCRRPLQPPQLCVITPGQVHYWEGVSDLDGWVVLFDDAFLLAHPGDRDLLRGLGERSGARLDTDEAADIEPVVTGMLREHGEQRPGMASVLQAYLHILVVRANRLPVDHDVPLTQTATVRPGPAAVLSQRFARLLTGPGGATGQSVRDWAAELGVSVSHLSESVKAATGRTPGQLVRQAQVLEAKRLLASTSLTVGRVAREVGFADAAYFCRFFRRETGITPGEFRRDSGVITSALPPAAGPPPGGIHHACRTSSIDAPQAAP
ncbi:AraC family transcriptional regulator [Streptomyces sp. N2-109]|uniref:AraC family transcriptional regulator n=1 Tax=Streptomyces gossypii TaxID=2883101 RepID=A0ABT2JXL8_9ACTN|nr:AraC family transcriptional regulator [Streptomyces gossypii]MCT2592647.1 AraC family transcriptional regulator [Streptomyces gossypii]